MKAAKNRLAIAQHSSISQNSVPLAIHSLNSQTLNSFQGQKESCFHHDFSQIPVHSSPSLSTSIQPKLRIGQAGDRYEQEADSVAQSVVQRLNIPAIQRDQTVPFEQQTLSKQQTAHTPTYNTVQMKLPLQSPHNQIVAPPGVENSIQEVRGRGRSLPNVIQEAMEQAFRADFSRVKIHTDQRSDQLN